MNVQKIILSMYALYIHMILYIILYIFVYIYIKNICIHMYNYISPPTPITYPPNPSPCYPTRDPVPHRPDPPIPPQQRSDVIQHYSCYLCHFLCSFTHACYLRSGLNTLRISCRE